MWKQNTHPCGARCWLVFIGICCAISPVAADVTASIGLEQAVSKTLKLNPALVAFDYQIESRRGRQTQAGLRPNPELDLLVENIGGSGTYDGVDRAETTLSLGWVLERGKRQARLAVAGADVTLSEAEADLRRIDAAAETARLFLDSLANQERLAQAQEAFSLAEATVSAVAERLRAGRTPDAELARAQAQLARTGLLREDLEHELETSNYRLAAQWGERQPDFLEVRGNLYEIPKIESFDRLNARLERNPALLRGFTRERLGEAELQLAASNAKPNWRISAGIRRLEQNDDQAFIAGITIPLAFRNRNQGGVAEASANLKGIEADTSAMRLQLETQLFAFYQELQHGVHRTNTLREDVLPKVEQALKDTQRAYDAGQYSYLELQLAQAEVLSTRKAYLEASIEAQGRRIEIERLIGTVNTSSVPQS